MFSLQVYIRTCQIEFNAIVWSGQDQRCQLGVEVVFVAESLSQLQIRLENKLHSEY